ncbi:ribonuclease HII [Risungbinella massiliensis]|uniref:ribonuclease HII n=1 Tax=Risungbinella massiliensis TaxID=1329796 RepID=UPI0005CC7695|nr:ribonuclease HII [Risungbinella massiliensis]
MEIPKRLADLKDWLNQQTELDESTLQLLQSDERVGVQKLLLTYQKRQEKEQQEFARLKRMWKYETLLRQKGFHYIAGVDEAGRGPLAGPVVAAAVILPENFEVTGLNDSKQVTAKQRADLKKRIEKDALSVGIGIIDVEYIDSVNILQATYQAMRVALSQLEPIPDHILADAVTIPKVAIPQQGLIKGDSLSHSIAAASIIAKTTRDEWMMRIAEKYPEYGFDRHMGYGTPEHLQALEQYGVTPIHRKSFAPVQKYVTPSLF